ncbi:Putative ELM2 domain, BAH domain, Zinc finger, PHD-type, Zinc finger, FYVE/PHD-type [Septoria linicola]|uniref:ELM2 domain, BAH domain, Zinc finger, PHD-type, Zinc finger, FYVE/PHD-type n=1 Tax=Septoria linicola TaxID=215465 RepID=A0A9Q9B1T3_9PEZI|nr:putative ELM2 domain, BAH domain, Zinc finger, PHD-type, Zinc finger, FYVE/PHD-type [Septoria linicola]USW54791.1 Putative ELM2 domain, BAH domain, Zinc finger, PHD-type, Zinc finger, FYVE/PHD-type [Septoria linicola]
MADEANSLSQPADMETGPQITSGSRAASASRDGTPNASFQAINSRAGSEIVRTSTPTATSQQRGSSSDLTPPRSDVVPPKAPQTAQTSTSVSQPSKLSSQMDNLDGAMAEASYGTRSRNRTSTRPNYAEDQDMDFEFSSAATTGKKKGTDVSTTAAQTVSEGAKRAPDAVTAQAVDGNAGNAKDSSTSTPTTTGTSKKRKAAGNAAAALQANAASATPPPAAARRPAASAGPSTLARETNVMSFLKTRNCLNKKGELIADDGTKLSVNDHVYLVCEPPGDPYYVCRIMEFLHTESDDPSSPVDALRVNWYYRPRDVQRFSSDTRLVFGTMHSDMCPLTSLRGKCTIKHRSEIEDLDAYRKERDCFYFVQVFDRFIRRSYECIPVKQIVNVPDKVKKALDERWKFVVVEIGRVKELTSAAKSCKRCARYCASNDSVDCAICKNSYHMNCVQPPLPKKPSRGFAWACGPCSRASEREHEARSTPNASGHVTEAEEEDVPLEENPTGLSSNTTRAPSPSGDDMVVDEHPATQAEIALAKMWPMRYLGIHARVEDALQYDDRAIYPRASSRLGPRHQANVNVWHGRPVELVKPAEIKKRYMKAGTQKKETKLTKESLAAIEADKEEKAKRPKWVQDEPPGYVARGEDYDAKDPRCTATPIFFMPPLDKPPKQADLNEQDPVKRNDKFVEAYLYRSKPLARGIGVPPFGTNFIDRAMKMLFDNKYNVDAALKALQKSDRVKDLHEPVLSKQDLIKFEEGVAKYGSEHRLIRLHMKTTLPHADIVRFYYLWKKTPKGREIWGNYGGRKKKKAEPAGDAGSKLQAELANDVDDSAFDNDKAVRKGRGFQCKFCNGTHSRQWRRAPGVSPGQLATTEKTEKGQKTDRKDRPLLALCLRCANLWRKYAIQWEEIDEVSRKVAQSGGRALKKKIDEELLRELIAANEAALNPPEPDLPFQSAGEPGEPPKKKSKKTAAVAAVPFAEPVEKPALPPPPPKEPTPPPPPIIPTQPTWKVLPCAVCKGYDGTIACAHCKLTVHRRCFGVGEHEGVRPTGEVHWICEQCQNDRNPMVSTDYSCCLCLTEETLVDLVEPPKVSHKKKTDREREKERLEKELADGMRNEYRNKQLNAHRPPMPREPLKRTTGNNWVHVSCSLWASELKYSNAQKLEIAEGFQLIPQPRYEAICKLCKNRDMNNKFRDNAGACINCTQCQAPFHASCAFEASYTFGFDVQPVKGSRKDQVTTATLGPETGSLNPVVLCKEHTFKGVLHPIDEFYEDIGKTALQIYAEAYKQADLTLTGTSRKAAEAQLTKDKKGLQSAVTQGANRRESGAHSIATAARRGARTSIVADTKIEPEEGTSELGAVPEAARRCAKCDVDVTPRWYPVPPKESAEEVMKTTEQDKVADPAQTAEKMNVRFMPPGANGRAWDGILERNSPAPGAEKEHGSGEVPPSAPVATPVKEQNAPSQAAETNGEPRPPFGEPIRVDQNDPATHAHGLPQGYIPPVTSTQPEERAELKEQEPTEWHCHKCHNDLKHNTSSGSEDGDKGKSLPLGAKRPTPAKIPSIEDQFHAIDNPPQPTPVQPPAPPIMNGMPGHGGNGPYAPHHHGGPPHHVYPQPFYQPNGHHAPSAPPIGSMHLHERQNSYGNFGYHPPRPSPIPPAPHYGPSFAQSHPRPPPLNGFAPPGQTPNNGMRSPHPGQPSPGYPPPPGHHAMQGLNRDGPYPGQLPSLGPPVHSNPHALFGRPGSQPQNGLQPQHPPPAQPPHPMNAPAPPPAQAQQSPAQHVQQAVQAPPTPSVPQAQQPGDQQGQSQQSTAPSDQPSAARPEGSDTTTPTTPRGAQVNGVTGASASPNLANLLH